jgi:myo-inositol-1-phosphate synthase/intein/homing endonuclease
MGKIRVAIAGVGNCASSLVQGVFYYRDAREDQEVPGLMHVNFGGYHIRDIEFVAAFDVDANKVGRDLGEAIFTPPNCTVKFCDVPKLGVEVMKAPVLDGLGKYLKSVIPVDPTQKEVDVAQVLRETKADVLINYVPVGSYHAARYYAKACLEAGVGFVNCMPEFIVSDPAWAKKFEEARIPCAGDDIKSQVGATILHRTLVKLLVDRGVKVEESYQLNIGGNSVTGDEEILLEVNGHLRRTRIGSFVDELMKKYGFTLKGEKEVLETTRIEEKIRCLTINDDYKLVLAPVTKLIRHKINEPLFEVILEGGRKIKITADHNLFTLREDGELKSIPVRELREGQTFVAVPTRLAPGAGVSYIDLAPFFKNSWAAKVEGEFLSIHEHPEIRIPVKFPISNEFLNIVGLWLADGSYDRSSNSNLEIAVGNEPECLDVIDRWAQTFNIRWKRRGKDGVAVRILSKTLGTIFKKVFGLSGDCYSKRVPDWVFSLSERQICEVLKGYMSGDGGIIGKQIRWTSTSPDLIRDIQTLLLQVGIYSTVFKENGRRSERSYPSTASLWHGIISSRESLEVFSEKIGFLQSRKNRLLRDLIRKRRFEKCFIPKIRLIEESGIKPTTTRNLPVIERRIILSQLDRVKDEAVREKLEKLCNSDIKFVKVERIRSLDPQSIYVYDLSVEGYERFICSNILVHNTDFLNMLEEERLSSKRVSKTEAVSSQIPYEVPLRIGPSDYVPFLKDRKICYIYIKGRKFGDVPLWIDCKLNVEDSPNSAGVVIDALRAVKLAKDRGIGGPLISVSAYFFKHPPVQLTDEEARKAVEEFIAGKRVR